MPPEAPGAYTVGPDVVTDTVTGLVWQRTQSGPSTWAQAITSCDALSLGGQADWRLPTRVELLSIVDSVRSSGASVNQTAFPATPPGRSWTSTPAASAPGEAWYVDFQFGGLAGWSAAGDSAGVRCVRGGMTAPNATPPARYAVGAGTVVDSVTGLTWQRTMAATTVDWSQAETYCRALNLGGFSAGWRLPTKKELESLVDVRRTNAPRLDVTAFPGASGDFVWTSTASAASTGFAWTVLFSLGLSTDLGVATPAGVRCVR